MPELCARFEDGTLSFLSIAALREGFRALSSVGGIDRINAHTFALSDWLYTQMVNMKHSNGRPLFELYSDHSKRDPSVQVWSLFLREICIFFIL